MLTIATRLFFACSLMGAILLSGISTSWAATPASTAPETKLAIDQVLRDGMDGIAALLAPQASALVAGQLPAPACKELATRVESFLATIAKSSKLPAKSEKPWQAILADMKQGLELLRSEKPGLQRAGGLALVQAVRNYSKYFDHPGMTL